LIDQKGDPFLVVGDSPWSLIAQLDETDIEWYLRGLPEQRLQFDVRLEQMEAVPSSPCP